MAAMMTAVIIMMMMMEKIKEKEWQPLPQKPSHMHLFLPAERQQCAAARIESDLDLNFSPVTYQLFICKLIA